MKNLVLNICKLLMLTSFALAQNADAIVGKYRLPNHLDIEIFKSGEKFVGKIIGLEGFNDGQEKDIHNSDLSKRDDPLLGKTIISNLAYDKSEKEWVGGNMYGPEKGLIFNLRITEIRKNEIEVVGSKYFFRKTLTWQKL